MPSPSPGARKVLAVPLLALCAAALTSCSSSDDLQPVSGKVVVKGTPAVGAVVAFHPDGAATVSTVTSTGTADEQGQFTLSTGDKKGAKPGKYVVTVIWPDPAKQPTEKQRLQGKEVEAPDLLGRRYADRNKSPLRAEVKAGVGTLDPIEIK